MKYAKLKNTEINASKIVLGTALFGTEISEKESFELLDFFFEQGGNAIDTANCYADWLSKEKQMSEKTIGKWLLESGLRDKAVIFTKGGHFDLETKMPRLEERLVKEDLEKSFVNLKTDYIDLYYLHKDDKTKSPQELIAMLNAAVKGFKVGALGVSNWSLDRIEEANRYAAREGLRPIVASQIQYSVARINATPDDILAMDEREYEGYCKTDLNLFAFSSQARGLFSVMEKGCLPEKYSSYNNEYNFSLFERLKEASLGKGVTAAQMALSSLISDEKLNVFALVGAKNTQQLGLCTSAADISLTQSEREYILKG